MLSSWLEDEDDDEMMSVPAVWAQTHNLGRCHPLLAAPEGQAGRQIGRQAGRQVGRQADRQAGRQAGMQSDRQAGRQAGSEPSHRA